MQNYQVLNIDCCANCMWANWDWDGVIECMQSEITEKRESNTTYLRLEVVSYLGTCDLYEGGRNVYLPEESNRD